MSSQTVACDTLKILHLPPHLSNDQRKVLLGKFGAQEVKTVRKSDKYTMSFAKFPSKREATEAFLRLHQLEVRGQRLSVEFAKKSIPMEFSDAASQSGESSQNERKEEAPTKPHFQAFLKKLNSWALSQVFTQPPPPNIWYKYSPPTKNTVLRIAVQLLKEPMFYTQVLHLMNRMNLPPPFEELETEFPMFREVYDVEKYKDIFSKLDPNKEETREELSEEEEEESELETEEETESRPKEIIPAKRKRLQSTKRLKIPKFVNPAKQTSSGSSSQKIVKPEDVFESIQRGENKNMRIALRTDSEKLLGAKNDAEAPLASSSTQQSETGFGLMFPRKKTDGNSAEDDQKSEKNEEQEFITSEQLAANRISSNDQRLLPVFKNYHAGKPSCRLYIKNLAKHVEMKDLHFIYQKYVSTNIKDTEYQYNVRLMQEGRMKGQAFVTLQNVNQALLALEETNGYILKDKPMVVQFAKTVNKSQTDNEKL